MSEKNVQYETQFSDLFKFTQRKRRKDIRYLNFYFYINAFVKNSIYSHLLLLLVHSVVKEKEHSVQNSLDYKFVEYSFFSSMSTMQTPNHSAEEGERERII